ncbi:DNA-dependent protein kinase catalytic subunit [Phytophthora citrophthora]|uniref:DNA-dependent protein kinase catalytic subunit n=1 Tax=Phytophthora citrophthora TaxID=4793 RepID=A0AAD9GIK3_9STRA|nr:DNA-dependent protein kinase catalytic subunit [Phytophthora citrophthora]
MCPMATKVGERLKELAAFLAHAQAVSSVEELLDHLQTDITDAMARSRASAQQCTILLFQSEEPPSLLHFLNASADFADDARKREISAARGLVLELLGVLLKTYGAHRSLTKQHVVDLYKACLQIARTDPFNRVKGHALTVVVNVLKYAKSRLTTDDIEPRAYVEKLFYDIKFSKATQTAKGQMLEVIGYLVEAFPKEVEEHVAMLLSWIETELDKQFSSNSPEMMLVNGLLFALARLLECDSEIYKSDDTLRKKIYSYVFTVFATTVSGNLSRYQVTNSSEIFLVKHAEMFQQEIGSNGHTWFSYMKFCCLSENKTIHEHAFACSNSIFQALNSYLVEAKDDVRKKCLNKVLKEVLPTVSDSTASTSPMAFAVQCLGWLAPSIYTYLGAKGYSKIEDKLKTFGESLLALDTKATAWRWSLVSQFVQCIGQFVKERRDVPLDEGYVQFLGDVLCHLMAAYPQCLWKSKTVVHKSVSAVFAAVANWTVLDPLVDRFVLHTLMLSISNVTDADQPAIYHPDTGELVTNLLYDYEGFWLALLRCRTDVIVESTPVLVGPTSGDVDMKEPTEVGRTLQAIIFDSTVKHALGIIRQLNLSYQFDLQTTNNGKNATGYSPTVPRDHSIMLNLTEFIERVISKVPRSLLRPWIPLLMHKIISFASKLPLVSSFYRIGTVLATAMDDLKYFDETLSSDAYGGRLHLHDGLAAFVQRVCVQARFYQDELLLTSSEFILAAPIGLVAIQNMAGTVRSILELGRSFLPAAIIAMTALERWQRQCPHEIENVISELTPLLSEYLAQEGFSEGNPPVKNSGKYKANVVSNESDLAQLQRRILLLLGKCDGKVSLSMSEPPLIVNAHGSIGSISSPFFRLELQLSEVSISLAMDPMLSHLGHLASSSSVRRVKSNASEGYHALVCYLCGKTMTHPHQAGKKTEFYDLWCGVFARVVRLATDPEKICRALFEPLLFQLLRWFATNSDTFPFEYASMLDELTRSLSDPEAAVRSMSARCIAALLSLALETPTTRINFEDIFERIFSLCRHPGAVQRSGAAACISYLLRSVSEEDGAVLAKFAVPCMKNLLYALRLCDGDTRNKVGGVDISRDVLSKAVMKIERGVCRFPQLFLKGSTSGRKADGDHILQEATIWLFQQTGAREVLFRRLCRRVFMTFSALVSKSSSEWIQQYASTHDSESITRVLVPMGPLALTIPDITVEWMEQLSASIESYVWCVEVVGDKARSIFELNPKNSRQESTKRTHTSEQTDPTQRGNQHILAWSIANILKNKGPWEDSSKQSRWVEAYLSALVSLCNSVKSYMNSGNVVLRDVVGMDNESFRAALVNKLLLTLVHQTNMQIPDASLFDEIKSFCASISVESQDWADQIQDTVDLLLSSMPVCLADVSSSETFEKHSRTIESISMFGSTITSAGIISSPASDKYAEMFALAASKTIKYGRGSPHDRFVTVVALKTAAACGWRIADIFANAVDQHVYAPVYSDVIHFLPTLAVWQRSAHDLMSLSLKNDFALNVLVEGLRQVTSFKVYTARSADWDAFTDTLVDNIKQFVKNVEVVKFDTQRALSLLQVLLCFLELCQQCSEKMVAALRLKPIADIQRAIIDLLKQRGCSYLVKADILRMLALLGPTSILTADQSGTNPTLDALTGFVFDEFPILSVDVARGSKEFDVFHLLLSELLGVIEQSSSIKYLKIIYPSLKEADKHLFEAEIKQALRRFSIALGSDAQSGNSQNCERVCRQLAELLDVLLDPSLELTIRKTLLEDVFTPLIECQTGETLLQFYLMQSLTKKSSIISLLATLISTSAEVSSGGSRIGVFVAYSLVEILYRLIDPEVIRTDINTAFLGHKNGKGREFTMLVCKCASKVVTKTYGDVDGLVRFACCAAYNCLLTAVSRTQKQEKFYDQILFQPALWSNIVDFSVEYELRAETAAFATIPLSSLSAVSLQTRLDTKAMANPTSKRNESSALQFFTASSLSMDTDSLAASTLSVPLDVDQMGSTYQHLEIELDEFNQHPCMIPLLRVLVQMKADFGGSWNINSMPGWMKKIFDVIVDPFTNLNVRLFLAKVVLNVPDVFTMYSSSWLCAVMDSLLDATVAQKLPEFSYILRDCCNLVLNSWKDVPVSSLDSASRFVNELIKLCPERNNVIRNSNVLMVTELIALWKDSVDIDVDVLITYINSDDDNTKMKSAKQFTALQVVSAMLSTGVNVENHGQTLEDGMLLVMTNRLASLYTLAAEVGGLYLQNNHLKSEEFLIKLQNLIISSYNDEDYGRFLALLRNASMHQPEIIDSMMLQRLAFVLPKAVSVDAWALLAADSLGCAAQNVSVVKDIFAHAQSVLDRFISHRHAGVQLSTLRAISNILDRLSLSELSRLVVDASEGGLGVLDNYEAHELSECRGLLFGVAQQLYDKDLLDPVKARVRSSLLRGLCDPDDQRRKEAFEYWNTSTTMMNSCSDRLISIFGPLYSARFADKWVLYATNLIFGMSKENSDFQQPLFSSALGGGEFTETYIDATWEAKTQSMAPLFSVEADLFSARQEPTQQSAGLTHTASSQADASFPSTMASQLFPSVGTMPNYSQVIGESDPAPNRQGRQRFSKLRSATDNTGVKDRSDYDRKSSKRFFQDQYALLRKKQEAHITREQKQRQGNVSMKRTYRSGEFPDIQISQQDIVEPIMALCEMHSETSSLVFGAMFSSIVATPQFEKSRNMAELAARLEETLTLSKESSSYVSCIASAYFASIVGNPRLCEALPLQPVAIGEAGLSSGTYNLSELVLEEQLIYKLQHMESNLKFASDEILATSWDLLHKVLSTVHKRNFLIALSMTSSTTEEFKLALQAQLSGDLPLAVASYKKAESILDSQKEALDNGNSFSTKAVTMRCRWQRLNCLETLNNWEALKSEITDVTEKDDESTWKQRPPYLEQGVGHYLRSCLGLSLATQEDSHLTSLLSFIESATRDPAKQELIQSRFPVEVCLSYLSSDDKTQTRVCVEKFYSDFLKMWRQTSPMASSSRMQLLQSLSSIVEIDEVLSCFGHDFSDNCKKEQRDVTGFIDRWKRLPPVTGEDGMMLWSQHTTVQDAITGFLLKFAKDQGILSSETRLDILGRKSSTMLQYANAAISCNILALASKKLKSYRELCNTHQLPKLSVEMVEVFVSHVLKLIDRQEHQSERSGLSSNAIKLITRYYETATKMFDNVEIMTMMETAEGNDQVAMGYLEAKTFASAAAFYAFNDVDDSLKEEYFSRSLDVFKISCQRIDGFSSKIAEDGASSSFLRCRLTFIEFLNDLLFKRKLEKLGNLADRKVLTKLLADNVLGGMAAGDRECAHYFPQICDVVSSYPDIAAEFEQYLLKNVPLWTCLQWSAQLMALLNGPIGKTIVVILEKLAEKYPVALFYDFMVTCRSSLDKFKVDLQRLQVLLANPVMEKFVTALRLIHHPELRLKEGLREVAKLIEDNRMSDARQKVESIWKDCFSPDRPLLGTKIGRYNRDWSRKAKRDVEKIMGKDGSKMTAKTVNSAREWIMNHFGVTPGKFGITRDMKAHLGDFAGWLEEFDHSSCSLELPGQYTSYWGPPNPTTHVRILSFDSMLGVLASKQLPKRLTVHCSDEKDYTFLVKGGEDLRLDQRIEQLFSVMNQILEADPRCRDQKLSLVTYDVIPMTQEIGILEWVGGTSTLKGVIEAQLQIDERCTDLKSNNRQKLELFNTTAAKTYESFLMKQRGSSYSAKVVAPHSKEVVDQFAKVQAMIPADLLRRQLLGLGSNYEAFLLVRDHFLKSLAVFSACSYVLGIGDRHLDNFLFDLASGQVIGIDFGVSFGAGASVLPVPELIPFRYTRQMDFVFQPYDGANLLAQEMQAVFDALRSKRQVVESVMNVFLHEPLLDWQQSTTTHQKVLFEEAEDDDRSTLPDSDVEMEDVEEVKRIRASRSSSKATASPGKGGATNAWLPDVKIAIARRKLEGVSPALLLKEELSQNPNLRQHIKKFHALVDGASTGEEGANEMITMSSLAQAQELLAMATAPDLLGRTFQGWMPWL